MHIAYITPEAVPFSKSGGLGDVAGALPRALAERGHRVSVFTPLYRVARKVEPHPEKVAEGAVPVGTEMVPWSAHRATAAPGQADFFLIANEQFFDREGIYGDARGNYTDACSRFIFFCRAALAAAEVLGEPVDVYHANDWPSALVPVYLKLAFPHHPFHGRAASLFTIHNLAYQGLFWHWDWPLLNLPWKHFNWKEMEFHGKLNLLKGALIYSDLLSTVSPAYAREIQTPEFGAGLDGVLAERADTLFGVINGIDTRAWDPARDPALPAAYSAAKLSGKAQCKQALLKRFGLPLRPERPLIGMIGRLVEQKGFKLVAQAFDELARRDLAVVILGTGEAKIQERLQRMKARYPKQVGLALAFDNKLAHLIQAGSDLHLMPSRFEPCGLNQLYALRYGTVPLVRATGGLADTVVDATEAALADDTATGFVFEEFTPGALLDGLGRALRLYKEDRAGWRALQQRGMNQDWSWSKSARAYEALYKRAGEKARREREA